MSLAHKGDTTGFPPNISFPNNDSVCRGCAEGKMHSKSYPDSQTRATWPFGKIHLDLKQFPIESYHKFKYFMSFFDDFSSRAWTVVLKTKGAANSAMQQFIAMVKNQYSTTIVEWMIDGGGEFNSTALEETLKNNGIKILKSAPYIHQQHGRAEQFNRTIMDKVEAMRHQASLPDSWWEFAINHTVYLYNSTYVCYIY